jgi:hypothetical protein
MSDDVRLGLIVGGTIAVALALLWRYLVLRRRKTRAMRGLDAADPQDRARAGIALVDEGLHRSARPLLAHVARERDDRVRHAIALAVARRQWEPVDTKPVSQLREWASLELEQRGEPVHGFGPAVTRLSDMGGPRPPAPSPPVGTRAGAATAAAEESSAPAPQPQRPAGVHWQAPEAGGTP